MYQYDAKPKAKKCNTLQVVISPFKGRRVKKLEEQEQVAWTNGRNCQGYKIKLEKALQVTYLATGYVVLHGIDIKHVPLQISYLCGIADNANVFRH